MGIVAVVAVVAEDKVFSLRDLLALHSIRGGGFNVRFVYGLVIDVDHALFYLDCVAGQGDDALDEVGLSSTWWLENNHLAHLGLAEAVDGFVDQQPLPVLEAGFHTATDHHEALHCGS